MEFYLDAKQNIKIDVDCDRVRPIVNEIVVREYSRPLNTRIYESLLWNLYNSVSIREQLNDSKKFDVCIGEQPFFEIDMETKTLKTMHTLTADEVRILGQGKFPGLMVGSGAFQKKAIAQRDVNTDFGIKTDLHSHLSAVLSGEDLIEVGSKSNISYPLKLALSIGLDVEGLIPDKNGKLKLNDILAKNPKNAKTMIDSLEICPYTYETFDRLEEIYTAREPFTKNKAILEPILWKIAEKYVNDGVEYVELSSTEVIRDLEFLCKMHEILPKIEEFWQRNGKTIKIRFLAAIARDAIEEKKNDEVDRIKEVARVSPYIVGVDFLGHESNPASAIGPQIQEMVTWASNLDWPFTIRIHGGETDIYDNVKQSLKFVEIAYKKELLKNPNAKLPPIRIGHAVYKMNSTESTDKSLNKLKMPDPEINRLIFELNVKGESAHTSNLALDNIMYYNEVVRRSINNGWPTLIATDGGGFYGTTSKEELILTRSDFSEEEIALARQLINETENEIIEMNSKGFELRMQRFNEMLNKQLEEEHTGNISSLFNFNYRNGAPAYIGNSKEVVDQNNRENKQKIIEFIRFMLEKSGINIVERDNYGGFEQRIAGKTPIMIANTALNANNFDLTEASSKMKEIIDFLVDSLDEEKAFFVIGGIKSGAEQYLLKRLHERKDKKFDVLDFVTEQALLKMEVMDKYRTITDAIILENKNKRSGFAIPKEVSRFLKEYKGMMIASQGDAVLADVITNVFNEGDIPLYLDSQSKGTTRNKAKLYHDFTYNQIEDSIYMFATAEDFKKLFSQNNPDIMDTSRNRSSQIEH